MEKNVRKNPFANQQVEQPTIQPEKRPSKTMPPKMEEAKTTLPPKFKNVETPSEDIYNPPTHKDIKTPQVTPNHYTDETNDMITKEFEGLRQFNASKSFLRLTTDK
jgi:hypothetical protein